MTLRILFIYLFTLSIHRKDSYKLQLYNITRIHDHSYIISSRLIDLESRHKNSIHRPNTICISSRSTPNLIELLDEFLYHPYSQVITT